MVRIFVRVRKLSVGHYELDRRISFRYNEHLHEAAPFSD